ncbi:MAG TPA: hypothetical protein RMH99_28150 [Sandaracinaceae bacterium LLY-WYZ-13_1]|nr:hypothetical protein [Sandaracinaceae bacterium LLY-WYZ-13_1]
MRGAGARLWQRWVVAFTLGELVGFGLIPALGGLGVFALTGSMPTAPRALLLYVVAVVGGFGEGAVLAAFQRRVLRTAWPTIAGRRWVVRTGAAASVAWAAGMLPPTLDDLVALPVEAHVALWVVAGIVILPSIGVAQASVLAEHAARPGRWVLWNVLGWLGGLPWTFVLPALVPDDAPLAAFGGAMLIGGVLMGATAGAITGVGLVRLTRR